MDGSPLSFVADAEESADIEIRVNFGVFAGREATIAEVDDLARELLGLLARVSIDSVRRHEFAAEHEATVHQVRVQADVADALAETGRDVLAGRLLDRVESWARRCVETRHAEVTEVDALP